MRPGLEMARKENSEGVGVRLMTLWKSSNHRLPVVVLLQSPVSLHEASIRMRKRCPSQMRTKELKTIPTQIKQIKESPIKQSNSAAKL